MLNSRENLQARNRIVNNTTIAEQDANITAKETNISDTKIAEPQAKLIAPEKERKANISKTIEDANKIIGELQQVINKLTNIETKITASEIGKPEAPTMLMPVAMVNDQVEAVGIVEADGS